MAQVTTSDGSALKKIWAIAGFLLIITLALNLIQPIASVLFLIFAGSLLGIGLSGIAEVTNRRLFMPRGISIVLSIFLLLGIPIAIGWIGGAQIAEQSSQLWSNIQSSIEKLRGLLAQTEIGRSLMAKATSSNLMPSASAALLSIGGAFSSVFSGAIDFIVILIIGIYIAVDPDVYSRNFVLLFSRERRPRITQVLGLTNLTLRRWLLGRLVSMLIMGVLVGIGYWIIGMPLALILALIIAIFEFIPFIGQILGVIPAVLVAFNQGWDMVISVLAIYIVIQAIESYLITPLVEQRAVSLPPAFLIAAQFLFGLMAGLPGIALATPLTVVIIISIQTFYVQDTLGEDVTTLGT